MYFLSGPNIRVGHWISRLASDRNDLSSIPSRGKGFVLFSRASRQALGHIYTRINGYRWGKTAAAWTCPDSSSGDVYACVFMTTPPSRGDSLSNIVALTGYNMRRDVFSWVDTRPGTNVTQQHLWAPAVCPLHRSMFSSLRSACCLLSLVSRSALSSTLKIEAICSS
jgi:hypothetical protein